MDRVRESVERAVVSAAITSINGTVLICLLIIYFADVVECVIPFDAQDTGFVGGGVDCITGSHSLDTLFLLSSDSIRLPLPDFRQCLLHQKLQLLNWCILR